MSLEITAAVADQPNEPFVISRLSIDDPRENEILVRIAGVGICHTDLAARDQMPLPRPIVLGHEGSGTVVKIGSAVTSLAVGDTVVLSFRSCRHCARCTIHECGYCDHVGELNMAGSRPDGSTALTGPNGPMHSSYFGQSSFATYAIAYEDNAVKVITDVPLHLLGPLGCGVLTGAASVLKALACPSGTSILITGGGAVGLSAVMGAKIAGCSAIIVSEPQPSRRALALELGATHVIDPMDGALAEQVRAILPEGVEFALDSSSVPSAIAQATAALATRGTLGLLGMPHDLEAPIPANMMDVLARGITIRGIIEGDSDPQLFIPEMLRFHADGLFPFEKLITAYPFEDINRAVEDHLAGRATKAVLTTGTP